jgi:ParB/RepB/Spo0J family partition protein
MAVTQTRNEPVACLVTQTPAWWYEDGGSGEIDPNLLAPDPEQPRTHMSERALEELTESIAFSGVREPVLITPRAFAPWSQPATKYADCPFLIVSGHRRIAAALRAGLDLVPVRIRIYPSEKDHRLDCSLLNKGRAQLTDLEEGYEIVRLRELGLTLAEVRRAFGYTTSHLYRKIALTYLHEDLQALLDPTLPVDTGLASSVGAALGNVKAPNLAEIRELHKEFGSEITLSTNGLTELTNMERRHHAQRLLHEVIRARRLNATIAIKFIKACALGFEAAKKNAHKGFQQNPPTLRGVQLETLLSQIADSPIVDWKPHEWRALQELPPEELAKLLEKVREAHGLLGEVRNRLEKSCDAKSSTTEAATTLTG